MKSFIEFIDVPTGCVRFDAHGPFPASYKYSVHFKRDPDDPMVEIFGFDYKDVPPREFAHIIGRINKATSKLCYYWRAVPYPHRVVQIDPGLINGRIKMAHEHKHHTAAEAKKSDGSVDQNVVAVTALEAVLAIFQGKLKVTKVENTPDKDNPKLMHYSFDAEIV